LDASFFIVYGFARIGFFQKIIQYLSAMGVSILRSATMDGNLTRMVLVAVVSAAVLFLIYAVFQGTAWWLCARFAGLREDYYQHMLSFTRVSLWWGLLFFVYSLLSIYFSVKSGVQNIPVSLAVRTVLTTYLAVIAYFAIVSYSLRPHSVKKSFSLGLRKFHHIIPYFLMVAALLAVLYLVLAPFSTNYVASLIIQILLVLPALALSRIFFIVALGKLGQKQV
jgi:hypothetical protein